MDITQEEFVATYLGLDVQATRSGVEYVPLADTPANDVDWRTKGVLNAVKNQGSCGSCWAFSAVGAAEPALALAGKGLHNFSEQELVDCSKSYGNNGCGGGWMDNAFQYIRDHGISDSAAYAYAGRDQSCQRQDGTYKISGFTDIPQGDCNTLESAV